MSRISAEARLEVRRRLLQAGADHLAREGLERASVDAIALAAGYAKGTFYNYFESKEQLFGEVIAEGARRAAVRYAAVQDRGTTRERLLALAAADVSVLREEEPFIKIVLREAMSFREKSYPLIIAHLEPYLRKVEAALSAGLAAGEIRVGQPVTLLALRFVGMLALLYVQHWGSGGTWPSLDDVPALAVDAFLDGAAAHDCGT